MNSFKFKNIDSKDMKILVNELPNIVKAPLKTETIAIDGRDGEIIIPLGYQSYKKTIAITTYEDTDIDSLMSWLSDSGDLILSNEPNKIYKARMDSSINLERLLRRRQSIIEFNVQPFKYLSDEELSVISSGDIILNKGTLNSLPLIKITGAGTTVLTINSKLFSLNIDEFLVIDSTNHLVLDKNLVHDGTRMSATEFPILEVGNNVISWTGNFSVELLKNTRFL